MYIFYLVILREARKLLRFYRPLYIINRYLKLSSKSDNFYLNMLKGLTKISSFFHCVFDSIYLLKINSIISNDNISIWRKLVLRFKLLTLIIHIIKNILSYNVHKDKELCKLISIQTIGMLFDLIPSVSASNLSKMTGWKFMEVLNNIHDGWVGLSGTISAVIESYVLIELFRKNSNEIFIN